MRFLALIHAHVHDGYPLCSHEAPSLDACNRQLDPEIAVPRDARDERHTAGVVAITFVCILQRRELKSLKQTVFAQRMNNHRHMHDYIRAEANAEAEEAARKDLSHSLHPVASAGCAREVANGCCEC